MASKDIAYYANLLKESELNSDTNFEEPGFSPVTVNAVWGDNDCMNVTINGIDGYSTSEIRIIIQAAFERKSALKLLGAAE